MLVKQRHQSNASAAATSFAGVGAGMAAGVGVDRSPKSPDLSTNPGLAERKNLYERCLPNDRARQRSEIDPDLLPIADRACLRLVFRAGAATSVQLAQIVYGSLRRTQKRLLLLHRAGLLERLALPDTRPGQAEFAYRLGPIGHGRLRTRSTPVSPMYLRHTLDTVAAVCALNRTSDRERPPLQLWYTDSTTGGILSRLVRRDSIVVVTTDAGSAVLALEIDERTEHQRWIRSKLAAYRRPLSSRPAWHLVVVVPGHLRAFWMLRQAAAVDLGEGTWVTTHADFARDSLDTVLRPLDPRGSPRSPRSLLTPPRRLTPAPVGSRAWLEVLAAGGGETEDGVLAP